MNQKKKAAPQNGTTPTTIATKLELVALHLLESGMDGVSALTGLSCLCDLNMRNSIGEIRRNHGVSILDKTFEHSHMGGGVTRLKQYWVADRDEARKVVALVNHQRQKRNAKPLSKRRAAGYLLRFPVASTDHHLPVA